MSLQITVSLDREQLAGLRKKVPAELRACTDDEIARAFALAGVSVPGCAMQPFVEGHLRASLELHPTEEKSQMPMTNDQAVTR